MATLREVILLLLPLGCLAKIDDNFDVTNILRLDKNAKGGYEVFGDFYVDIGGDARGLPLVRNSKPPSVDSGYENFCCRNWVREGWKEVAVVGEPTPILDTDKQLDGQTVAAIWQLDNATGELKSQTTQLPENKICVTVLTRLPVNATLTLKIQSTDGFKSSRISTLRGRDLGYDWALRRFEVRTPRDFRKKPAVLVISAEKPENDGAVFVQWAGFCEPGAKPVRVSVNGKFISRNVSEQVRHVMTMGLTKRDLVHDDACQNGGRLNPYAGVCVCAPGFSGEVCETGCGPNKYGLRCTGVCSSSREGRDCAGFKVCDTGSCACIAGWEGERCDVQCRPGWYGSDCDQKCGSCKGGDTCDRHTGQCEDGCEEGFEPPYCQNVCGRQASRNSLKDGTVGDPKDFPWNVAVYDADQGGAVPQIICSATLISRSLAVSAAHCFFNEATSQVEEPSRYSVVLGKQRHALDAQDLYEDKIQRRKLRGIHVPSSFRGKSRSYFDDIAMLELDLPVDPSEVARPVCFDWTGRFQPDLEGIGAGEVVGWGRNESGEVVDKMLLARPTYLPLSSCLKTVRTNFLRYLTPDKFCGENTGGQSVSRGNSGGGLVFDSFLVGITSVAHHQDYKTIAFTNVTYHRSWLNRMRSQSELREAIFTKLLKA